MLSIFKIEIKIDSKCFFFLLCCHFFYCCFGAVGLMLCLAMLNAASFYTRPLTLPPSGLLPFFSAELSTYISFFCLFFQSFLLYFCSTLFASTGIICTGTLVFAFDSFSLLYLVCSALLCLCIWTFVCLANATVFVRVFVRGV